jgi:iron(III) transport system substrate-binding protein
MRRTNLRTASAMAAAAAIMGVSALTAAAEETFNLDAVLAAAKQEKPINIYDSTGKIVEMADKFSAKYGLKATGVKVSANSQLEMIIRESQSNNVQGDVVLITDAPSALAQLLPAGFVENYLPGDMTSKIPAQFQNPLAISTNANVWAYNTEAYDKCPVTNIWELTEPKWKGKVAMVDPLSKSTYTDWFNQLEAHGNEKVAAAYKAHSGKEMEEKGAAAAWIKALAANGPLATDGDDPVAAEFGQISRQCRQGLQARPLHRSRSLGRLDLYQARPDGLQDQKPEHGQALYPLRPDGRGHRPADEGRQAADQYRHQDAG